MVASETVISPEHVEAFDRLDDDEKRAFSTSEMHSVLNTEFVEYALRDFPNETTCPKAFQVTATRFDDGLTSDSFSRAVSSVYKPERAGILCVQKHLKPHGPGSSNFDFRRGGGGVQSRR